jgi:hypothetical protein
MRRLALLALVALAAFPLSAHGRWSRPHRRVVVVEEPYRPARRWEADRWDRHGWYRPGCEEDRVILRPLPPPRPLAPPFQGRVELWFR